jgi:hypothetical protein
MVCRLSRLAFFVLPAARQPQPACARSRLRAVAGLFRLTRHHRMRTPGMALGSQKARHLEAKLLYCPALWSSLTKTSARDLLPIYNHRFRNAQPPSARAAFSLFLLHNCGHERFCARGRLLRSVLTQHGKWKPSAARRVAGAVSSDKHAPSWPGLHTSSARPNLPYPDARLPHLGQQSASCCPVASGVLCPRSRVTRYLP